MPVTVYPRLGDVLRGQNLTVAELERQIEQRYGVQVDRKSCRRGPLRAIYSNMGICQVARRA